MNPSKVPDYEITPCTDCKVHKKRIRTNMVNGQYVFRDETGFKWYGRKCPPCGRAYQARANAKCKNNKPESVKAPQGPHRNRRFTIRTSTKDYVPGPDEGPNHPLYLTKMRPCRDCGMKTANYFRCHGCLSAVVEVSEMAWGI